MPARRNPESPDRVFCVGSEKERKWTTPEPKDRRGPKVRWSSELLDDVAMCEAQFSLRGGGAHE